MTTTHTQLLIIGGGPAGYTAAIYAARAMLKPIVVEGLQPGGQLTITTEVDNYPGFAQGIQGPDLMVAMRAQAEHVGTQIVNDVVVKVDFTRRPFTATLDSGHVYVAQSVIIATGAQAKWLGLESEYKFQGHGVSACATCDGFFYRGKQVLVVGGGNTAVEEALFLTKFAEKVTVIHRRENFRAERILQDRLFANPKVEVLWNTALDEVLGSEAPKSVTHVRLKNTKTGLTTELPIDGVFIAIGHQPATALFESQLKLKPSGCIWVEPGTCNTSIEGIFAAGDVADDVYRQAVTAAGLGCMAALDAERYLEHAKAHAPIMVAMV